MGNPYRPRVRRTADGRYVPAEQVVPPLAFPTDRLARILPSDDVDYWRAVYEALPEDDRAEILATWDASTDAELYDELETSDEPVPGGSVDEVLAWVDAEIDPWTREARARAALHHEQAGRRRSTLIDGLRRVLRG